MKIKFIGFDQEEPKKEFVGHVLGINSNENLRVMVDVSDNGKESWKQTEVNPNKVTGVFFTSFGQEIELSFTATKCNFSSVI